VRLSYTALHLSWILTERRLGQSAVSLASRSVSLASQPYCREPLDVVPLAQHSQTTERTGARTSDRRVAPSRGMVRSSVDENEAGT
jgi:hypothetical protein